MKMYGMNDLNQWFLYPHFLFYRGVCCTWQYCQLCCFEQEIRASHSNRGRRQKGQLMDRWQAKLLNGKKIKKT